MTDGLIGFEHEVVEAKRTRLPQGCRVHAIGVGPAVNRSLTGPVARAGGGAEIIVGLGEEPEPAAARLLARTTAPLVVDVEVTGSAVARNLAVSELRRQRVRPADIEGLGRAGGDVPAPRPEPDPDLREIIEKCRERLPPKPRQALAMRLDGDGRPDVELAAAVGMRLNTFLQNIRRARIHLADCLKRHGINLGGEA